MKYTPLFLSLFFIAAPLLANEGEKRERDPESMLPHSMAVKRPNTMNMDSAEEETTIHGAQEEPNSEGKRPPSDEVENPAPQKKQALSSNNDLKKNEVVLSDEEILGLVKDCSELLDLPLQLKIFIRAQNIDTLIEVSKKHPQDHSLSYVIGLCYEYAIGCEDTPENKNKAGPWYHKAGVGGKTEALCHLGRILQYAIGYADTVENKEKAVLCYQVAAKRENLWAMNQLGFCYENSVGCKDTLQNKQRAITCYRKAAEGGYIEAMMNLGNALREGIHRDSDEISVQDKNEALQWYLKAANLEHLPAMNKVGDWYYKYWMERYYEEPQEELMQNIILWYRKGAMGEDAKAMFNLAYCLKRGIGCEGTYEDEQEAVLWYRMAAESGDVDAARNLANCLKKGVGCEDTPANKQEAVGWYIWYAIANEFECFVRGDSPLTRICEIFGNISKQETKPVHQIDPKEEYMGAGKGLNLLGQMVHFSALICHEYEPKLNHESSLSPDVAEYPNEAKSKIEAKSKMWDSENMIFTRLQALLNSIHDNTKCFIPTSPEVLTLVKQGSWIPDVPYPLAMEASAENLESLETIFPIRFYHINGQDYLTVGDPNVKICNEFLILLHNLCGQDQDMNPVCSGETLQNLRKTQNIQFELGLNQRMRQESFPGVTQEDLKKAEAMLQFKQVVLERECPHVRVLRDYDDNPTEYRYFEAAAVLKDMLYGYIKDSRPYKYWAAIECEELGPFQNYARP
jgi:TPR repeat protein